jgi:ribosome assembly protein YihI (activator of Der GTPase)
MIKMAEETKDEAEKILESMSEEERLKLLERLIQGASEAREENMSVEERLERLEDIVLGHRGIGIRGKRIRVHRLRGHRRWMSDLGDFTCCI